MDRTDNYLRVLARSWRIPGFVLLALGTHLIVEAIACHHYRRGYFILLNLFLLPFVVSTFVRRRKALFGAAINGAYILLLFSDLVLLLHWPLILHSPLTYPIFRQFVILLTFALLSGACTGILQERLCKKFCNK